MLEILGKIGAPAKNSSLDWLKVSERGGGGKERFLQGCSCNESFLSSARSFYGMYGNLLIRLFILGQGAEINMYPHYLFHWKSVFGNVHGGGWGRSKSSVFRESAFVRQTKRPFLPPLLPCLSLPPFFRVPLLFFSRTFFREKGEKPSSFPLVSFHHHLSTLMRFSAVAAAPALPPSGGQGEATAFPLQFHEQ